MRPLKFLLLTALLVFVGVPCATSAATFSRNLHRGDTGADVRLLQQTLNENPTTRVAESGPGSLDEETEYFGALTEDAVIRFQERYASEVLSPIGLSRGTGFVGVMTRARLAQIDTGVTVFDTSFDGTKATPSSVRTTTTQNITPRITRISPSSGKAGTQVTIHGSGFTEDNTINAGFKRFENVSSDDGTTLSFVVESIFPPNTDFPPFFNKAVPTIDYGMFIENENGHSNAIHFLLTF